MEWDLAAKHADQLFDRCNWSRATIYLYEGCLSLHEDDRREPTRRYGGTDYTTFQVIIFIANFNIKNTIVNV